MDVPLHDVDKEIEAQKRSETFQSLHSKWIEIQFLPELTFYASDSKVPARYVIFLPGECKFLNSKDHVFTLFSAKPRALMTLNYISIS